MGLFSKLFKESKEKKELFACAKILCLIASLDKEISEEEIVRIGADLEFLGFNLDDIKEKDIVRIWKEAAENAAAFRMLGSLTLSEFFNEIKKEVALWDYEKRVKLLMSAAGIAEAREKVTSTSGELDILAGLAHAIGIDSEHVTEIIKPVLDKCKWDISGEK